jgi:hypothetical protein
MVSGHFRRPNMTFQWNDEIYIPDLHSRITILDRDDNLIAHLCEWENGCQLPNWPDFPHAMRRQPGKFTSPHGIYVDEEGSMYVVEWIEDGRIAKLKRS